MLIPAGEFYMGSTPLEIGQVRRIDPTFKKEWEHEEQPQHRVRISRPFYMGAHEVTRSEFAQFVRATGYLTDSKRDGREAAGSMRQRAGSNRTQFTTGKTPVSRRRIATPL